MLLGQGKHDPFTSGQTGELPAAVFQSLDYTFEVLWPKNTPFLQGVALESAIRHWRVQGIQSALEAHSQICAAASLGLALTQDPATARILASVRTTHQLKTFQLIREAIHSLSGPPSTNLLAAINQISVSGEGDLGPILVDGFPKSPMYSVFNSELYERFSPIGNDHHYRAIAVLIKQSGGLDALPPGLAHGILLEDVQRASHRIGEPLLPLPTVLHHHRLSPYLDTEAENLLAVLGSGFRFRPSGERLRIMIQQASEFTEALDQYQRGSSSCQLSDLATQAVIIQHRFLSLPAIERGSKISWRETQYYEIARISAIMYVGMVIQPHVSAPLLRQRQTKLLQDQLLLCFQQRKERGPFLDHYSSMGSDFDKLLLWALVLGAIAAFPATSDTRGWFVRYLRTNIYVRGLTWYEFKDEVHSFLFWDYVMGKAVEDLLTAENIFG